VRTDLFYVVGLGLLLLFASGCDEDPTSVGEGILPDEDFVSIDTLIIEAHESYSIDEPIVTSGASNIFAGENENVRISSIFRFDTLLTQRGITPDTVLSAEEFNATLLLEPVYYLGDSTETITVNLFEATSGWSTSGFNRDVFETVRRGSESLDSKSVMIGDTNLVEFTLPRQLLHRWAQLADDMVIPPGLIIDSTEDANGIIGFGGTAGDTAPRLRIIYGTQASQDTVILSQNARAYGAYLKENADLENKLMVQAATASRGVVRFNLDELPRGALIHNAQLQLTRNPSQSISHPGTVDSLSAHHITDINKYTLRTQNAGPLTPVETDEATGEALYTANISEIIQAWLTVEDNNGLIVRDGNETLGLHRTSFYTHRTEDATKRPRLKIIFSRM